MGEFFRARWFVLFFVCLLCSCGRHTGLKDQSAQKPAGAWSAAQAGGVFWLQTPAGERFYSKGANCIESWDTNKSRSQRSFYWANQYTSRDAWRRDAEARLKTWGFNTRGGWSDNSTDMALPLCVELDLGRRAKLHWFDPFDSANGEITYRIARELTAPYRSHPGLIGYFTDNEAGWWNAPLFLWYLKGPWENHTKQKLWQELYSTYNGDWKKLLGDFVPAPGIASFDDLKAVGARLQLRPGGQGIHFINYFTGLCARRYYQLVYDSLRRAHPGALILGDRLPLYYNQSAVRAMADFVDVVSTNYNIPVEDGWVAPYYFEGLTKLAGKPILISEFFFCARENRSGNRNNGHLLTVQTQAERARGAAAALRNFARFPAVVGSHWFQMYDEPTGGRGDGEDYNMGLIDIFNKPYEELTGQLAEENQKLEKIHAAARELEAAAPAVIEQARAPIRLTDATLTDWDKQATRITPLVVDGPGVPFGDVHMAWTPDGLYLFCLASSYVEKDLLAYTGQYPLSEAFQLHVAIGGEGNKREYAVCIMPRRSSQFKNELEIEPRLYVCKNGEPDKQLTAAGRLQKIPKPLPHIAFELFLPAQALGVTKLSHGQRLAVDLKVTSFYRDQTMRWRGSGTGPTVMLH
jgi:hypothetical protein